MHPSIEKCPTCRIDIVHNVTRQRILEKVVQVILKSEPEACQYNCEFKSTLKDVSWHEKICSAKKANCFMKDITGCSFSAPLNLMWQHYREKFPMISPTLAFTQRIPNIKRASIFHGRIEGYKSKGNEPHNTYDDKYWVPILLDDKCFNSLGPVCLQIWRSYNGKFSLTVRMLAEKEILKEIRVKFVIGKYSIQSHKEITWKGHPVNMNLPLSLISPDHILTIDNGDLIGLCNHSENVWFTFAIELMMSEFLTTTKNDWVNQDNN